MTEHQAPTLDKSSLLASIDTSWSALQDLIARIPEEQFTQPTDDGGWTVKDHLAHVNHWERSMVALLHRQPRHEGLGVSEELYLADDLDALNTAMQQETRDSAVDEIVRDLESTHRELVTLIQQMPESELQQPYSHFLPDEPGADDKDPIINRLFANGSHHLDTHRQYIERIIA